MTLTQQPLELILARNLITNLSTPAVLMDEHGALVFCNQAAAELLGGDFKQRASLGPGAWEQIGPFDAQGERVESDCLPMNVARREGSPCHARLRIRAFDGRQHEIEVSALPILTTQGARGALAFFWPQSAPS
jgi:PAS domain-containing protein